MRQAAPLHRQHDRMATTQPGIGMSLGTPRRSTPATTKRKTLGFGFDPAASPYHFALVRQPNGGASVVERFGAGDEPAAGGDQPVPAAAEKARLSAYLWERVAEAAAAEFNGR